MKCQHSRQEAAKSIDEPRLGALPSSDQQENWKPGKLGISEENYIDVW